MVARETDVIYYPIKRKENEDRSNCGSSQNRKICTTTFTIGTTGKDV